MSCRYVRAEVLAGFVNGLFLIFTAFFIFSEGVEVCYEVSYTINSHVSICRAYLIGKNGKIEKYWLKICDLNRE